MYNTSWRCHPTICAALRLMFAFAVLQGGRHGAIWSEQPHVCADWASGAAATGGTQQAAAEAAEAPRSRTGRVAIGHLGLNVVAQMPLSIGPWHMHCTTGGMPHTKGWSWAVCGGGGRGWKCTSGTPGHHTYVCASCFSSACTAPLRQRVCRRWNRVQLQLQVQRKCSGSESGRPQIHPERAHASSHSSAHFAVNVHHSRARSVPPLLLRRPLAPPLLPLPCWHCVHAVQKQKEADEAKARAQMEAALAASDGASWGMGPDAEDDDELGGREGKEVNWRTYVEKHGGNLTDRQTKLLDKIR